MKTQTDEFYAKEYATERKPVEIYKLWTTGGSAWYYTSGDITVTYDGHDYVPAPLKRGATQFDSSLDVSTLDITVARVGDPVPEYISSNPVDVVWIEVSLLFRDQTPYEKSVIFYGQIKNVVVRGVQAEVKCVGFEYYLKQPIPTRRYTPNCNWRPFDANCKLSGELYKLTTSFVLDPTGLKLTSNALSGESSIEGYFTRGYIVSGEVKRMIADHKGNVIWIRYPISGASGEVTFDVYPGCDGKIETCRDKFNNVVNFFGFPYIPLDNPTTWI